MSNQSLKSYLLKAKYVLVFLKSPPVKVKLRKYKSVHIPNINFKTNISLPVALQRSISARKKISQFKQILKTPKETKFSPISSSSIQLSTPYSVIEKIQENQNLHNLHYIQIYYSKRCRATNLVKGWKISSTVAISRQFQFVYKHSFIRELDKKRRNINKINELDDLSKEENLQPSDKENVAIEKECASRRNYRISTSLST